MSLAHKKKKRQSSLESFLDGGSSAEPLRVKQPRRTRDGSHFGLCPICNRKIALHQLAIHASSCDGPPSFSSSPKPSTGATRDDDEVAEDEPLRVIEKRGNPAEKCSILEPASQPIPGLFVYPDFVSNDEEARILAQLDGTDSEYRHEFLPWKPANFNGPHNGKRWGVHCNLRDRRVSAPENPLPSFFREILMPKLSMLTPMKGCKPNEANAIDYRKSRGDYLVSHVDDRKLSKEPIANLSLAGDCTMTFNNVAKERNTAVPVFRLELPRRCLVVLTGRARYDFAHGIDAGDIYSERRVSVTMRESPLTMAKPVKAPAQKEWWKVSVPSHIGKPCWIRPTEQPLPGLFLFADFISEDEEAAIMKELDDPTSVAKWSFEQHSGRHVEKRFGVDHDLWSRERRKPKHEVPTFVRSVLIPRLKMVAAMNGITPNEVNAIDYRRRQGHSLKAHVDDRKKHKEPIANLSLVGDCYMTYTNSSPQRNAVPTTKQRVLLKRRCLQVLTGKARYDFAHGIENDDLMSDRRVSLTMRETVWSDAG